MVTSITFEVNFDIFVVRVVVPVSPEKDSSAYAVQSAMSSFSCKLQSKMLVLHGGNNMLASAG